MIPPTVISILFFIKFATQVCIQITEVVKCNVASCLSIHPQLQLQLQLQHYNQFNQPVAYTRQKLILLK